MNDCDSLSFFSSLCMTVCRLSYEDFAVVPQSQIIIDWKLHENTKMILIGRADCSSHNHDIHIFFSDGGTFIVDECGDLMQGLYGMVIAICDIVYRYLTILKVSSQILLKHPENPRVYQSANCHNNTSKYFFTSCRRVTANTRFA